MKGKLIKRIGIVGTTTAASVAIGLSGVAAAAPAVSTTGPGSYNKVAHHMSSDFNAHNRNDVWVGNMNEQFAQSGAATGAVQTIGGSESTGNASNSNHTRTNVNLKNRLFSSMSMGGSSSGSAAGFIGITGPGSTNVIRSNYDSSTNVSNRNKVNVNNQSYQAAQSGDATSYDNTIGGGASVPSSWGDLNPDTCMQEGMSYSAWSAYVSTYENYWQQNWQQSSGDQNWTPSSEGWQSDWVSYNPEVWMNNGSSYQNWYDHFNQYQSQYNSGSWESSEGSGGESTGNAHNSNNTRSNVDINNSVKAQSSMGGSSNGSAAAFIGITGPGSTNKIVSNSSNDVNAHNRNTVNVTNGNAQVARSGEADSSVQTIGGDASTGDANNSNHTRSNVDLTNTAKNDRQSGSSGPSSVSMGRIWVTGPGSTNKIVKSSSNEYNASNRNNVNVNNSNDQVARSGDATSYDSTIGGGDVSTGDASNSNHTRNNVDITNRVSRPASSSSNQGGSGGFIGITGPGSTNVIRSTSDSSTNISNRNKVNVNNDNTQAAVSGDATSAVQTIGGDPSTGNVHNKNHTKSVVSVDNKA
jgi:hypothetical protein